MATQLNTNGLYVGGTSRLAGIVHDVGSALTYYIHGYNISTTPSGTSTYSNSRTINETLPNIDVGSSRAWSASVSSNDKPTSVTLRVPSSGRYLYTTSSTSSVTYSDVELTLSSSRTIGISGGATIVNRRNANGNAISSSGSYYRIS